MYKRLYLLALSVFILILALTAIDARPAQAAGFYVVQPGDSLFSIAGRFNVSISELATINKIYDVNVLYVGQVLSLPDPLPSGGIQVMPMGSQGATTISTGYTSMSSGVAPIYTPPIVSYPAGTTVTTVTTYKSYVVRPGDFLGAIADAFNTTPDAILGANAINDPNLLYVGQLLTIPRVSTSISPRPRVIGVVTNPMRSNNVYIVQPGDNLFSIAARTGHNAWSIARANGILDLNAIYVGEPIVIP